MSNNLDLDKAVTEMSGLIWSQTIYKGYQQMTCFNAKGKIQWFDLKLTNNLDPDQASMVVFTDIMYTYRDTQ